MKQLRVLAGLITLITPLLVAGQTLAASQTITQEIHVTAIVPAHRDIVVDDSNHILEIVSNTSQDVTPTVYYRTDGSPSNIRPLTDKLFTAYRQFVPKGTAKTGILYWFSPLNLASFNPTSHFISQTDPSSGLVAAGNRQLPWQNHFERSLFIVE